MFKLKKKRAQSTLEYATLIIVVIAALIAVQKYVKRSVEGSLAKSADDISETQFEADLMVHERKSNFSTRTRETQSTTGTRSTLLDNELSHALEKMWFRSSGGGSSLINVSVNEAENNIF